MNPGPPNPGPSAPSSTEVQTARVPAPRTLVRKDTDLRPTLRVPAPLAPIASEQANTWDQSARGDVSMLPAISPASLRQLAAQRENTANMSDAQGPSNSPALPPQPPYAGQGNGNNPYPQWLPVQPGLPAPGAQAPIPVPQGYNGGYGPSLAEPPRPDYEPDYTGEQDAYDSSREDETGRYQASGGWNSDEYSREYTGVGYRAVDDSREMDSWTGEESTHDRYPAERDFSPTQLGLPHLTNPAMAANGASAWHDIASGALPRDSRGQRGWDSAAAGTEMISPPIGEVAWATTTLQGTACRCRATLHPCSRLEKPIGRIWKPWTPIAVCAHAHRSRSRIRESGRTAWERSGAMLDGFAGSSPSFSCWYWWTWA